MTADDDNTKKRRERKKCPPARLNSTGTAELCLADPEGESNAVRTAIQLQHRPEHGVEHPANSQAGNPSDQGTGTACLVAEVPAPVRKARAARTNVREKLGRTALAKIKESAGLAPVPEAVAQELRVRQALQEAAMVIFGNGNLPINPATGKKWYGTGKKPNSGTRSPMLLGRDLPIDSAKVFATRRLTARERAAALQERMRRFSEIYNAAYLVRDSQHGAEQRRQQCIQQFVVALVEQLRTSQDWEALIYAVADSLTLNPLGVPWE